MLKKLLLNPRLRQILFLVFIGFFVIIGVLSFLFFTYSLRVFEKSELLRLQGISNAVALQISGDDHQAMMQKHPAKDNIYNSSSDPIYANIHQILVANADANLLKTPIYTLVKSEDESYYEFGVTSNEHPYFRHAYHSYPSHILEMYEQGGTIPTYKDEYGTWLSAFSPITDSKGKQVAILMVDQPLEAFIKANYSQLIRNIAFSIIIFGFMYFAIVYLLSQILHRENEDKTVLSDYNKQLEKVKSQLEIAYHDVQNSEFTRREIMANLSHDLRTPLSSIIGYTDLLLSQDSLPKEKQNHYTSIIHHEGHRLLNMVNDMLELSKLEAGVITIHPEAFLLQDLIYDVVQKYEVALAAKNVELKFEIHPNLPLVYGDIKYIDRLFQNLLDNAVKYVFQHSFILISVKYNEENQDIKVAISNQGKIIPLDMRDHIFERYYKGPDEGGGTGLGLAISKKICELHQRTLSLEVNGNINSFIFSIPLFEA